MKAFRAWLVSPVVASAVMACGQLLGLDYGVDPKPPSEICTPGATRDCELEGECSVGSQFCESDGRWGRCRGDAAASCDPPDPPRSSGVCRPGESQRCGETSTGNCEFGARQCVDGDWGPCVGAVLPQPRNCASTADNDCDGDPDDESPACRCRVGDEQACLDQLSDGACREGRQVCGLGADGAANAWGVCIASSPRAPDCNVSEDLDCDGEDDDARVGTRCSVNEPGLCGGGQFVCENSVLFCLVTEECEQPPVAGTLSFERDVWPIFVASCGASPCHGSSGIGGLSIGSSDPNEAFPDAIDFENQVLTEIESGDMPIGCGAPPGGGATCLAEDEYETILAWYGAGAPE